VNGNSVQHANHYHSRVIRHPLFGIFDLTRRRGEHDERGVLLSIREDGAEYDVFLTLAQARRMVKGLQREINSAEARRIAR